MARIRPVLRIVLPYREWIDMQKARVNRAVGIAGSTDRIVLLSWSAEHEPLNRNVLRIDRHGNVVWRAELPGKAASDCFVSLERDGDGVVARTYSEWAVRLDVDGRTQQLVRVAAAA